MTRGQTSSPWMTETPFDPLVVAYVCALNGARTPGDVFVHLGDNFEISMTITTIKPGLTIRFRFVNTLNYWNLYADGAGAFDFRSYTDSVPSAAYGYIAHGLTNGSILKITCIANRIKIYSDGVLKINHLCAGEHENGTDALLYEFGAGGAVSNVSSWKVDALGKRISYLLATNTSQQILLSRAYVSQQFGTMLAWNMSTYEGLQWATPDINPNTFAPTGLDIDQWMTAIATSGAKYATLTVKHHDGFALWPTTFAVPARDPYGIEVTNWYITNGSPDVTDLFVDACRANGIKPSFYFSMWDRTYEARVGAATFDAAYLAMIETQLTELLTDYGSIGSLWFDAWGVQMGHGEMTYSHIYNLIKFIQPSCLLIHNSHLFPTTTSQITTYEDGFDVDDVPAENTILSEVASTVRIDGAWFYDSTSDQTGAALKLAADIKTNIATYSARYATYLLDFTPNKVGVLPAAQVTRLAEIGA